MAGCAPVANLASMLPPPVSPPAVVGDGMEAGAAFEPFLPPAAAAQEVVAVRPGRPTITASALRGMPVSEVSALLGPPSFVRRDAKAEIWQYFGPGCVLDLFVYDEGGARRVLHHHLRSQVPGKPVEARCFDDIVAGGRGSRPS